MARMTHESGTGCEVPDDWEVSRVDERSVLAIEPADEDGGFRANLVLTVADNGDLDFAEWQRQTDALLPEVLGEYLLLDLEKLPVAGTDGGRRLAHYVGEDLRALVMEQWCVQVGSTGYTLTATVDSLRYDVAAGLFEACAETLEVAR